VIAIFLLALMFWKDRLMRPVASGPIYFAVFQHDAAIFVLILLLYAAGSAVAKISSTNGPRHITLAIVAKACVAASLVIAFLYAADAFDYYFSPRAYMPPTS
jgi:hypothetical protein